MRPTLDFTLLYWHWNIYQPPRRINLFTMETILLLLVSALLCFLLFYKSIEWFEKI